MGQPAHLRHAAIRCAELQGFPDGEPAIPEGFRIWDPGLYAPLEPGATLIYRGTFLGRSYETPAVCTALSENKQFATKSTARPLYIEIDTTVEPGGRGHPGHELLPR